MIDRSDREGLRALFNEVPELYERTRPPYPDAVFADLVEITRLGEHSSVLEVGCGTGQATMPLAEVGCTITAVELGEAMADVARRRVAAFPRVTIETAAFESWDDAGRRFNALVSASAWHWIDIEVRWRRAHELIVPGGWLALIGNAVIRDPAEPEAYAVTADLHERFAPGNPMWGHPPTADDVLPGLAGDDIAHVPLAFDLSGDRQSTVDLFEPVITRIHPMVAWYDATGYVDYLRTTSTYRALDPEVREPLLEAIAERLRSELDDRVARRYLSVVRAARRRD